MKCIRCSSERLLPYLFHFQAAMLCLAKECDLKTLNFEKQKKNEFKSAQAIGRGEKNPRESSKPKCKSCRRGSKSNSREQTFQMQLGGTLKIELASDLTACVPARIQLREPFR
jgi:hypothetical protein